MRTLASLQLNRPDQLIAAMSQTTRRVQSKAATEPIDAASFDNEESNEIGKMQQMHGCSK